MCLICVVEEARLKIQYAVIGEQLKAVKLKKVQLMLCLKGSVGSGGECQRCRDLTAQGALNRRLSAATARKRRRTGSDDVEPSSDDSVTIVGEDAP